METFFQNLADEFEDKADLVDDLNKEVKDLPNIKNDDLKENIFKLEKSNSQLTNEATQLQAIVSELCEEASSLQENNNRVFDEYQDLKIDHGSFLLHLTKNDEAIQGLLVCRQNLEEEVYWLQHVEKKIIAIQFPSSPITTSTFDALDCSLAIGKTIDVDVLLASDVVSHRFEKHTTGVGPNY